MEKGNDLALVQGWWLGVSSLSGQCALSPAEEESWGTLTTDEWLLEFINYISHKQLVLTKVSGKML